MMFEQKWCFVLIAVQTQLQVCKDVFKKSDRSLKLFYLIVLACV